MFEATALPRTVLITGAGTRIGYDTAHRLAAQGCTVVVHATTPERGDQTLEQLVKDGADPLCLDLVHANFADLGEVARMARRVAEAHPRLDLLVTTPVTVGADMRILTEDGNELTFQANYLAPYLLTRLLEGALSKALAGRVVNCSSSLHRGGTINWTDLNQNHRRHYQLAVYAQSMLALTMFTTAFDEFSENTITAVSVDPGTNDPALLHLHGRRAQPHDDAAAILTQLCSPNFPVRRGNFYDHLQPAAPVPFVQDRCAVLRLWKLSERLTGLA